MDEIDLTFHHYLEKFEFTMHIIQFSVVPKSTNQFQVLERRLIRESDY